ncbi:hypothetical protein VT84_23655 [Gemmata sp. SH-PL17]|nr:hypothetical protein VT84_23655 [Gemmata sp. SH-PL17]
MRGIRGTFTFVTAVAIIGLLALSWRTQVQTQQKLDALAALGAERPVAVAAAPAPTPVPTPVAPAALPRELQKIALPPYVIEAPDQLSIEVAVKDPKTGKPTGTLMSLQTPLLCIPLRKIQDTGTDRVSAIRAGRSYFIGIAFSTSSTFARPPCVLLTVAKTIFRLPSMTKVDGYAVSFFASQRKLYALVKA